MSASGATLTSRDAGKGAAQAQLARREICVVALVALAPFMEAHFAGMAAGARLALIAGQGFRVPSVVVAPSVGRRVAVSNYVH